MLQLIDGSRLPRQLLTLASIAVLAACPSVDQEESSAVAPPGQATDSPCVLALTPTTVTEEPDREGTIPNPERGLAMDGAGRLYTRVSEPGVVAQWGADGRFLATVGRRGQGPREFGLIGALHAGPGDTIHAFHEGRWSLISPDLTVTPVARSARLPSGAHRLVHLEDGRLLVPGWSSTSGERRVTVVDRAGAVVDELGAGRFTQLSRYASSSLAFGVAYPGSGNTFWVGPVEVGPTRYVLERWDLTGRVLSRQTFHAPWLEAHLEVDDPRILVGLSQHGPGVVHITLDVPNPAPEPGAEGMAGGARWPRFEFLDVRTGTTLASGWFGYPGETVGGWWGRLPNSGYTYRIVTNAEGLSRVELLRIDLVPREGPDGERCVDPFAAP